MWYQAIQQSVFASLMRAIWTLMAYGLLAIALLIAVQYAEIRESMVHGDHREEVTTPPPEPPQERNTSAALLSINSIDNVRDWDNMGRLLPLLL